MLSEQITGTKIRDIYIYFIEDTFFLRFLFFSNIVNRCLYIIYIYQVYFILSLFFSLFCFYRKENLLLYKEIVHSVCIVIKGRILRSKSFGTPAFHVYIYVKDIKSIESLFRAGYIYDNCVSSSKITSVMLSDRAFPEFINPMKPRRNVARRSIGSHVYRLSSLKGMNDFPSSSR